MKSKKTREKMTKQMAAESRKPLSDLKLKALGPSDRELLEALYIDFQVEPSADANALNLAAPVLVLLRSIVRERSGIDPDLWAREKIKKAKMGLVVTAGDDDAKGEKVGDAQLGNPGLHTFYFATSATKYK